MKRNFEAMDKIFNPEAVAVIGASDNPGKLGSHVMRSLIDGGYPGVIHPVNPGKNEIFGIKAYNSLLYVPQRVDLSIIILPAEAVPKIIEECSIKGVKGIVLITAGFKEIEDRRGEILQSEITQLANRFGIRIIGPNTFGIVNLHLPLNASFTPEFSMVEKGEISFVSQSGGMSHLMAFLSMKDHIGMSKIVGLGNRCNTDFSDMVEYLLYDPLTRVIAMYLEGIDEPRRLIEVMKKTDERKPIVAYKAGRSSTSDKASQFHTGSLAGRHEIYEGAFRQTGILTVGNSEELLDTAKALSMSPLPKGNRVAVLSGQAGPGMIACDICEAEGLSIPPFSIETQRRINKLLPPLAIRTNPIDMGPAWYDSEATSEIVKAVLEEENIDAIILCIMFASANRAALGAITKLLRNRRIDKPLICCFSSPSWIWDKEIKDLEESKIPNYPTPERAARVLSNLLRQKRLNDRRI